MNSRVQYKDNNERYYYLYIGAFPYNFVAVLRKRAIKALR